MIRQGRYISLLKAASAGELVGKAIRLAGKGTKKIQRGAGIVGEDVARGMGVNPKAGKAVGSAILPGAATVGAAETDAGKQLRARKGILVPSEYGGSF